MNYKAFNTITGQYFKKGSGCFSEECHHKATVLDEPQLAFVRATFRNVGSIHTAKAEWPVCECEECEPRVPDTEIRCRSNDPSGFGFAPLS